VKSWPRLLPENPGREKPKGVSGGWPANRRSDREGFPEGSKPRNRGLPGRPTGRHCGGGPLGPPAGKTAGGFIRGGDASDTLREEKTPKGESQERCRCEKEPAGNTKGVKRREGNQTLRTERSGQAKPAAGGPSIPQVLKGAQAHERSRSTGG